MSIYNPLTYTTIRIFFVLICNVIYLHLRYRLVLCCVNSRLRTALTIVPQSTAPYCECDRLVFVLHHCVDVWILLQREGGVGWGHQLGSIKGGPGCHLTCSPPGTFHRYFHHRLHSFSRSICVYSSFVRAVFICVYCGFGSFDLIVVNLAFRQI